MYSRTNLQLLAAAFLGGSFASNALALVTAQPRTFNEIPLGNTDPIYGLNFQGVASIQQTIDPDFFVNSASAVLLENGRYVLAAYHTVDGDVDRTDVVFDFPVVGERARVARSIIKHPNATGDPADGFDVALIDMGDNVDFVQQFDAPVYKLESGFDLSFGDEIVLAGYGPPGDGPTGFDDQFRIDALPRDGGDAGSVKAVGRNTFDGTYFDLNLLHTAPGDLQERAFRNASIMAWDFDNGDPQRSVFGDSGVSDGDGLQEAHVARGDSGGPVFLEDGAGGLIIAGIIGGGSRTLKDVNGDADSSFGEQGFATRLNANNLDDPNTAAREDLSTIAQWVGRRAGISTAFGNPNGGSWDVAGDWFFGGLPGAGLDVSLSIGSLSTVVVTGPQQAAAVQSLLVGTGLGVKALLLDQSGALTIAEGLVIDVNGFVGLSSGDLVVDELIVQGDTPAPGPPTPVGGSFVWSNSVLPSSLTAEKIVVRAAGAYVHRTTTGVMNVNHLDIETGARVLLNADVSINQSVTNGWDLFLTETSVGNTLTVGTAGVPSSGSYTQTSQGGLNLVLGGTASGEFDRMLVHGDVSLAGGLVQQVFTGGGFTPALYDSFEIITADTGGSISGTFDVVSNVTDLGIDRTLAVTYTATEVLATLAIFGDANLDGRVSFFDFQTLQGNFGLAGTWVEGDYDQNGIVNFADFQLLEANFGFDLALGGMTALSASEIASLQSFAVANVPEPGTLLVLAVGGLGAVGRRPVRNAA